MGKTKLLFGAIAFFILVGLVSAEVKEINKGFYGIINDDGSLTETQTQIKNFNAIGFICGNDDCSNVIGTLWNGEVQNSGNDHELILNYSTKLLGEGYGVFFYKDGYFPFEAKIDYYGSQSKMANNYLSRKQNCQVPINDLIISHYGNKVVVNVTLSSAVSSPVLHAGPLNYVPNLIKHLYAVDANVSFSFVGPQNTALVKDVNIPASESRRVSVSVDNLKAGEYQLIVESNANDVKCINSVPLKVHSNLLIENNRTNATLPTVSILSPEAKTYKNKTIFVNIRTTNATSILYNWNGINISYTAPVYVTFNEGPNTLTAYAINEVTTAKISVTFNVNTSVEQNDTTPPGKISNLMVHHLTNESIEWMWENPTDADFAYSIIYLNGINVLNSSVESYKAINLKPDTIYTISIKTSDINRNINPDAAVNSARTLKNGVPQGDGNISINILSPTNKIYSQSLILIEIAAENATNIKFSSGNIINRSYTGLTYLSFANGTHTLHVYAYNSKYSAMKHVTFRVELNGSVIDLTAPDSVSGLVLTGRTDKSLTWSWANPNDADFAYNIIYLNGVNILNTNASTYTANSLKADTEYTIRINTIDFSGNVNLTDISNSAKTLESGKKDDGDKKKKEWPVEFLEEEQPAQFNMGFLNFSDGGGVELNQIEKKGGFNLIVILLAASCILLILLIIIIASWKR